MNCSIEGCDRKRHARGWCAMHWKRWRKHGDPLVRQIAERGSQRGVCTFDGCERTMYCRFVCRPHYDQFIRNGGKMKAVRPPAVPGKYTDSRNGYVWLTGHHGNPDANKSGRIPEHRVVMAEMIGRPLMPHENVHHINGVRNDNRPANLELWSTHQPSGQRIADKVIWAKQVLELYEPDALA